jgi:MFS family permease
VILSLTVCSGINLLIYYSTIIFSQVGLSPFLSSLLAAVMNTLFAAGTWFTPSTIEKGGRRWIMLWTSTLLTIFMLIFVVMINLGDKKTNVTQWTAVASVVAYIFFFGYGWVGIPWLYGPEVNDHKTRYPEGLIICSHVLDCTPSLPTFGGFFWCHW